MRLRFTRVVIFGLLAAAVAGCAGSAPVPVVATAAAVAPEKPKVDDLKSFDGTWQLKSSRVKSSAGTYSLNRGEETDSIFRIRDGVMEMREDDESWVKSATLALGTEPQSLLFSKSDASGTRRVLLLRYKLDGNTLVTVQDNLYLDILPDSFDIEGGVDRQRQINTYVRTDR